jgi:hypothetical protein
MWGFIVDKKSSGAYLRAFIVRWFYWTTVVLEAELRLLMASRAIW